MGGNAFVDVGKIHTSEINDTVSEVMGKLKIRNYRILGSTGKKEFSGDIDIAVNRTLVENIMTDGKSELVNKLSKLVGMDNIRIYGNCHSIQYPIIGYNSDHGLDCSVKRTGLVQIDFIAGDIDWLEFFYFWDENSKLKGTHRNIAISTLANHIGVKVYDDTVDGQGRYVNVSRYKWSPKNGLQYVNRVTPKDGDGNFRKTQRETILSEGITCPEKIADVLFSGKLSSDYLRSAETVIEAIAVVYPEQSDDILKHIAYRFENNHNVESYLEYYPDVIRKIVEDGDFGKYTD